MSGSLQAKMYGGGRFGSSTTKRMVSYNQGAMKKLGHSNGTIKRLGQNQGSSSGKNPMMEMYPRN